MSAASAGPPAGTAPSSLALRERLLASFLEDPAVVLAEHNDSLASMYLPTDARVVLITCSEDTRALRSTVDGVVSESTGNIRELEHCIESAVVLCRGPVVLPAHLALPKGDESTPKVSATPAGMTLAEVEKRHILRTLEAAEGNRTRAAALLDIGRNTLARKRRQYGLA
jgi:transcriptional regulator with AAA-type ATPase domain